MAKYQHFDPRHMAELAHHYLTSMVDEKNGYLPYWLILPNQKPAEAAHCRVDDAELVGSWYEGLDSAMQVLETEEGKEVLSGFEAFLRSSWGPMGLRYHNPYPWTHTMHASFHEMGYILPALNRILRKNPGDQEMEEMFRQADIALYYVKDHGRDGCCFYSDALKGKTKPHHDT